MMVKLDMNVDDCISMYKELSQRIFKQWHILGYMSGGFGPVKKFSSKNLEKVLLEHVIRPALREPRFHGIDAEKYLMEEISTHRDIMCSVVCNELYENTRQRAPEAFFICSHWKSEDSQDRLICTQSCRKTGKKADVQVIQAARATSAAPTYFKHVDLLNSLLVDGGYGFTNNPSHAAYEHYFLGLSGPQKYRCIRMVNIGTGTEPKRADDWQPQRSFVDYIPWFQGAARTTGDLAKMATDSERVGKQMHVLAAMSKELGSDLLKFERFSADRGEIHQISLYDYKAIGHIEQITEEYLQDEGVLRRLEESAEQLAETCRTRERQDTAGTEQEVTVSTIIHPEQQTEPYMLPEITFSAPSTDIPQTSEQHQDTESIPVNVPELTYESARASIEPPRTPAGDNQSLHEEPRTEQIKSRDAHDGGHSGFLSYLSFLRRRQPQQ